MSSITTQGRLLSPTLVENPINPYDKTIYTEPDGSTWIRIIHHNNPANARFVQSDSFTTYVYKDADRWFYGSLVNFINNGMYEFMVKQKQTSTSAEEKYRWIQYKNPYDAVYNDVKRANVTINTSSEYNQSSVSGGIYKLASSSYFVVCNASNGNWFGAFGSWTAYQGGIPGFPNTTVTTGYMDLYLRIGTTYSVYENSIGSQEFIEY